MLVECSKEEVEDRMRGITRRSLVSTEWSTYDECRVYWIHDLLRDHLVARGAGRDKVGLGLVLLYWIVILYTCTW